MRIAFLVITAFWVISTGVVLYTLQTTNGAIGITILGITTFCLGVCAILEGLRKIEKK